MIVKSKLFGGYCKLTLGAGGSAWDVTFVGPGVLKDSPAKIEVCTEFGDAVYDKRCVVGYILSAIREEVENAPDIAESKDDPGEKLEV